MRLAIILWISVLGKKPVDMKKLLTTIGVLGLFCTIAAAGFKVPRHVHSDLDEAKKEAVEKGKPLLYVYTDPASS